MFLYNDKFWDRLLIGRATGQTKIFTRKYNGLLLTHGPFTYALKCVTMYTHHVKSHTARSGIVVQYLYISLL